MGSSNSSFLLALDRVCLLARSRLLLSSLAITCTPCPTRPDDARHHAFPSGAMPLQGPMTRGGQRSLVLEKVRTADWCTFPISGPTLSHPTFIPVSRLIMSDGASQETMRRRRRRTGKKTTEPDTAVKENPASPPPAKQKREEVDDFDVDDFLDGLFPPRETKKDQQEEDEAAPLLQNPDKPECPRCYVGLEYHESPRSDGTVWRYVR